MSAIESALRGAHSADLLPTAASAVCPASMRIHLEAVHELCLRTAVHEAGHTVVGLRAGFRFTRRRSVLRVDADGYGHCLMAHHLPASTEARLLQSMAGRVAEGRWLNCYEPEIHREIQNGGELPDGIGSLSDQRLELKIAFEKSGHGALDAMFARLGECRLLAERIVADPGVWADIQRLAAELYSAGRLSARDVEAILRCGRLRQIARTKPNIRDDQRRHPIVDTLTLAWRKYLAGPSPVILHPGARGASRP
jgi:hypothetical protein